MKNRRCVVRKLFICLSAAALSVIALAVIFTVTANILMLRKAGGRIFKSEDTGIPSDIDTIIVLGCGIKANGEPSDMLRDRLITAADAAEKFPDAKILLTGDHLNSTYDEISVMKRVITELGVSEERIDCDGYGLCTYDSMVRASKLYGVKKAIVVTQKYHLPRAIYTGLNYGIDSYGIEADIRNYRGAMYRNVREILARNKDVIINVYRKSPQMGDAESPDRIYFSSAS